MCLSFDYTLHTQVENCQVFLGRVPPQQSLADSLSHVHYWFAREGNTLAAARRTSSGMLVAVSMDARVGGTIDELAPNSFRIVNGRGALSASDACANDPTSCRPCTAMVLATGDVAWPSLTQVTSNWTSHMVEVYNHPYLDPMDAGNGTLILRGGHMRVSLDAAKLGAIDADLQHGSISMQHLTLTASSPHHRSSYSYSAAEWPPPPWSLRTLGAGGATADAVAAGASRAPHDGASRLITADGDVHVSLLHSANVTYAQRKDARCLAAANVERSAQDCIEWNVTTAVASGGASNATQAVNAVFQACAGSAFLCTAGDEGCSYGPDVLQLQALHAAAAHGGVYISAIGTPSRPESAFVAGTAVGPPLAQLECAAAEDGDLPANVTVQAGSSMVTPLSPPLNVTELAAARGISLAAATALTGGVTVALQPTSLARLRAARRWIDSAPGFNFAVLCCTCVCVVG